MDEAFLNQISAAILVLSFVIGAVLSVLKAPYGRFAENKEYPGIVKSVLAALHVELDPRLAWILMECPSLVSIYFFLSGGLYNCLNGYLQGSYLGGVERKPIELSSIHFIIGVLMFCLGMFINLHSDMLLRRLRKPGETAYKIPHGGAFNLVTDSLLTFLAGNYLGELLEWLGYTLAGWNFVALQFFIFTTSNLAPRARANHKWFLEKFPEYPKNRKILIPWVW